MLRHEVQAWGGRVVRSLGRRKQVVAIVLGAGLFYGLIAGIRYIGMHDSVYDLTIFDQAINGYAHGQAPASYARGVSNLLGDHFHPVLALLAPLYWIAPSPLTLVLAQVVLLVLALPAVYGLARQLGFSERLAQVLMGGAAIGPGLLLMVQFDFHELAVAVPCFAWAIYALYARRWWLCAGLLVLLGLTKENLWLLVATIGIVALVQQRRYWFGVGVLVGGISGYLVTTRLLIPYFAQGAAYTYWTYGTLGPDLPSALRSIVVHPLHAVAIALHPAKKLVLLGKTFGPVLALPILSPLGIICIPLLAERLLSSNPNYWVFGYHYQALLGLAVWLAAMDGLARLLRWLPPQRAHLRRLAYRGVPLLMGALNAGLFVSIIILTYRAGGYRVDLARYTQAAAVTAHIPADASVCTTNHTGPYVRRTRVVALEWKTPQVACDVVVYQATLDGGRAVAERRLGPALAAYHVRYQAAGWTVLER